MIKFEPNTQQKLFGLNKHILELIRLYKANLYPNKLLLSGQKGIGKSTLAYHFINYVLSKDEHFKYDIENFHTKWLKDKKSNIVADNNILDVSTKKILSIINNKELHLIN